MGSGLVMGRILWVVLGIAVACGVWALVFADRVRMIDLAEGYIIGDGVAQDWDKVCFYPEYNQPKEFHRHLEEMTCPTWENVEEWSILIVYTNEENCTSIGEIGDFQWPSNNAAMCYSRAEADGEVLKTDGRIVQIHWSGGDPRE